MSNTASQPDDNQPHRSDKNWMINEPEWSGTLVLRWRLGDNLSDKWFILSDESSEWTVHFYGSDVSFKVIIILISCTYVTINSSFSMPKMRSQQTHVHAINIMHTVSTECLTECWPIHRSTMERFYYSIKLNMTLAIIMRETIIWDRKMFDFKVTLKKNAPTQNCVHSKCP